MPVNPEPKRQPQLSTDDGTTTVVLTGELDMTDAARLQQLLLEAVRTAPVVTVDIAAVGFIDSTVISALVTARNEALATGCHFVLANPTAPVRRILQITGVLDALVTAPPQTP